MLKDCGLGLVLVHDLLRVHRTELIAPCTRDSIGQSGVCVNKSCLNLERSFVIESMTMNDVTYLKPSQLGSPDIKVGLSPGRSDQKSYDLGRIRLIDGFFWDLPEQCFLASVDGRLRRPHSG